MGIERASDGRDVGDHLLHGTFRCASWEEYHLHREKTVLTNTPPPDALSIPIRLILCLFVLGGIGGYNFSLSLQCL